MYTLYGRQGSGSFAVQVALEEIGTAYQRIWVGAEAADVARLRAMNPTGRVPALVLPDGAVMFESAAMLIHLALAHPQSALAPQPGLGQHSSLLEDRIGNGTDMRIDALQVTDQIEVQR